MQRVRDNLRTGEGSPPPWQQREGSLPRDAGPFLSRLDFRRVSSHLSQKRPGYYLILLRNELRHRSFRDKPALTE
jgi:hypothetical protein